MKINKLSATLLALFIFICCASITIFAIEGDNSGTGNGAIKGSGTWTEDQVGYRFTLLTSTGTQVGDSVDILFSNPPNNREDLITSNRNYGKESSKQLVIGDTFKDEEGKIIDVSDMPRPPLIISTYLFNCNRVYNIFK